jgi:acid stress-induced BolA-like protein IbaG/YrbA
MRTEEIQRLIEAGLPGCQARVTGDGTHFEAVVVCDAFRDKGLLQRHRMVYGSLGDLMQSAIHALSLKTYTPDEAGAQSGS